MTLGLRKESDQWVVPHAHHSFADTSVPPEVAERDVRAIHDFWSVSTRAGDLDALMAPIDPSIVSFEHAGAMEYVGLDAVREVCSAGLAAAPDGADMDTPDLTVRVGGDLAVSWGVDRIRTGRRDDTMAQQRSRGTRVFQRRDGEWRMVHQHLSFPADPG